MTADTLTRPLTEPERALVAQYHKLIYRVIEDCHLPNDAAADAYGVDASAITLNTDIREDLSNESMKMIVMISTIEEELDVTIEIQEASNLNTIGEFVAVVRERM